MIIINGGPGTKDRYVLLVADKFICKKWVVAVSFSRLVFYTPVLHRRCCDHHIHCAVIIKIRIGSTVRKCREGQSPISAFINEREIAFVTESVVVEFYLRICSIIFNLPTSPVVFDDTL